MDESNERIHENDAQDTNDRDRNNTPVPLNEVQRQNGGTGPLEDGDEGRVVTVQRAPSTSRRALLILRTAK